MLFPVRVCDYRHVLIVRRRQQDREYYACSLFDIVQLYAMVAGFLRVFEQALDRTVRERVEDHVPVAVGMLLIQSQQRVYDLLTVKVVL